MSTALLRPVAILVLFATAFGYLEAAVVSYLRTLHEPPRRHFYPDRDAGELFPLLTLEQIKVAAPEQQRTIIVEIGREAATMLMLAAIALAVARNAREWGAAFAISFGFWDIAFYIWLKVLLGWPVSLFTRDILFLIPVPWVGPVLAPVLVSLGIITAGIWCLSREAESDPLRIGLWNITGVVSGALVIILSFTMDDREIMAGAIPRRFHWGIFALGMVLGLVSYGLGGIRLGMDRIDVDEIAEVNYLDEGGNTVEVKLKDGTINRYNGADHPEIFAVLNHWSPPTA